MGNETNTPTPELPFSYHTFIYPFIFSKKSGLTEKNLKECGWKSDIGFNDTGCYKKESEKISFSNPQTRLDYAAYQYFTPSARKALLTDSGIMKCYCYDLGQDARYIINLEEEKQEDTTIMNPQEEPQEASQEEEKKEEKPFSYSLHLNAIRLMLYHSFGVGLIFFECEFFPDGGSWREKITAVKSINEYGRRLFPPFVTPQGTNSLLCANELCLEMDGKPLVSDKVGSFTLDRSHKFSPFPNLIGGLFPNSRVKTDTFEPAVDDRMFVCCCVRCPNYADYLTTGSDACSPQSGGACYEFMQNYQIAKDLYEFINIDKDTGCSCNCMSELQRHFNEQLYLRWIDYGTIHAITNHSIMLLTGENVQDDVVNPFLTQYVQLAALTLVQRATLIHFDSRISKDQSRSAITAIATDYGRALAQLLIPEPTHQIQGIEYYERLQKMLFISNLNENVKEQINNCFETEDVKQGSLFNKVALWLALATLFIEIVPAPWDAESTNCLLNPFSAKKTIIIGIFILIAIIASRTEILNGSKHLRHQFRKEIKDLLHSKI